MKIGVYNYHQGGDQNDSYFFDASSGLGENLNQPTVYLRSFFEQRGHIITSIANDSIENFDAIIFMEFPSLPFLNPYFKKALASGKPLYLILVEPPTVRPENYNVRNHKYFKKVFTWAEYLLSRPNYVRLPIAQNIPEFFAWKGFSEKERFALMITSHKRSNQKNELYSERIRAIRFFEKYHPEQFDLFGFGWNSFRFKGRLFGRYLSRFSRLDSIVHKNATKYFFKEFSSWKGSVDHKIETMKNYKFSICYENTTGVDGYITEKIFDCFAAGCVPVYLGAPDISRWIPRNTFIDKRKFSTYEDLYSYMDSIGQEEYDRYLANIKDFLEHGSEYFSAHHLSQTLLTEIESDLCLK